MFRRLFCSMYIEHLEQKMSPKLAKNFICEHCDYNCCKKSDMNKHVLTAKHINRTNRTEKSPEVANIYICELCDYKCCKKSDMNKHKLTAKHKNRINRTINSQKVAEIFECECGKVYKARNSLWYHKKKCTYEDTMNDDITINEPTSDAITILLLLHLFTFQTPNLCVNIIIYKYNIIIKWII